MAVLRAIQFYAGVPPVVGGVNTWTTVYTVPAGHRVKLANAVMTNNGATGHTGAYRTSAATIIRQVSLSALGASGSTDNFSPLIVLNPAEVLQVLQVPGATVAYWLSGYIYFV